MRGFGGATDPESMDLSGSDGPGVSRRFERSVQIDQARRSGLRRTSCAAMTTSRESTNLDLGVSYSHGHNAPQARSTTSIIGRFTTKLYGDGCHDAVASAAALDLSFLRRPLGVRLEQSRSSPADATERVSVTTSRATTSSRAAGSPASAMIIRPRRRCGARRQRRIGSS